ncbi:MAG: HAD-IC family P-type ATPase [Thermoplasmata archaeon]|nr:HAD-IC family P-type ATPase [Thermoplasmata archaeon]
MRGLTSEEVSQRRAQGLVNDADVKTSRTYTDIFVKNAFTPFNIVLFILGILLLICEEPISAVSATGIIIVNILISTIQEMRAKRRLDKISLLTRPKVKVVRDGQQVEVDQNDVVKDDVVLLEAGDQAVVDGVIEECKSLEMDESLLTGESSTVRKKAGDTIYSGSNCVTGQAYYTVTSFGADSYASQMLSSAKKFTSKKTPLQMETGTVTKMLMAIAAVLFIITIIKSIFITHESFSKTLEVFVLCLDVVPIALFLLITLTYMIAAMRMADSGVLLQRSSSVESISHVDTVCMDKTGTITTNKLRFEDSWDLISPVDAGHVISVFATSTGSRNRTVDALIEHYGETSSELLEEVQFSSDRKYSAVRVKDGDETYNIYMGAWTALGSHVRSEYDVPGYIEAQSKKGLRTVLICKGPDTPLHDADENPVIGEMEPVSVVSIRDEVRPDCRQTIQVFMDNGMDLKVISGDDPVTVDSLFTIAGIPGERKIVSGPELDAMSHEEFTKAALECNIFGRMRPENKEQVIETLKNNGHYVAMIGDGVNDVKSLKTAQVGVSLESGAGAARGVADMILIDDNFSALPKALVEGRRTVSGMRDILKLYLTRNFTLAVLFVIIYVLFGNIPMIPIQNTFYAFISVSIMAFFMTLFAKADENKDLILPDVLRYCIPSSIMIALFGLIVYGTAWYAVTSGSLVIDFDAMAQTIKFDGTGADLIAKLSWNGSGVEEIVARTAMVLFVTLAGLMQIFIICPRWRIFSVDGRTNKSLVPFVITLLILALVVTMYVYFPALAVEFIGFALLPNECYLAIVCFVALLMVLELFVLKRNVFKRIIDRFEAYYMRKLDEEYSEGDVVEERNADLKKMADLRNLKDLTDIPGIKDIKDQFKKN